MNKLEELYNLNDIEITDKNIIKLEGCFLKVFLPDPLIVFNKNFGNLKDIPLTKGGVYLFYDKTINKIVYVGTTNNLTKRLSEHFCRGGKFNKEKHIIYWYIFENDFERRVFEKLYQWAFKPKYGIEDKRKGYSFNKE